MRQKGKEGLLKKKSGGGPPDLSGAGSRDGCPRLKVLQVPRKKNAPMNVVISGSVSTDVCVLSSKGGELSLSCVWCVYCSKTEDPCV